MSDKPIDAETPDKPPSHPEKMTGTVELKLGKLGTITALRRSACSMQKRDELVNVERLMCVPIEGLWPPIALG